MPFRVAIVGDSAMWGQGLLREHTFAYLAAARIAASIGDEVEVIPGRSHTAPLRGEARSGAKIQAVPEISKPTHVPGEPHTVMFRPGDHTAFIATYPTLFHNDAERTNFLSGSDETPATRLYGEVPATFPTVSEAVHHLAGASVAAQLVILNGGINDVDFEGILDPDGPAIADIDAGIEEIFGDRLSDLLRAARNAFASAVIMVCGYFSPLSDQTDGSELKTFFEYYKDIPAWELTVNDAVQTVPVFNDLLNATGWFEDPDAAVERSIGRALAAAAHAHFWTLRTIATLPPEVLGPGIIYAHPAFGPDNAAFSGQRSFVHEGYRPPGQGRHSVGDEMLETRLGNIPRIQLLEDFQAIIDLILIQADHAQIVGLLRSVLTQADLPVPLRATAQQIIDGAHALPGGPLVQELARETKRIQNAIIASFLHPNEFGARRYADRIVAAFDEHQIFSVRSAIPPMAGSGEQAVSVRRVLRARGLDPTRGLRPLAPLAVIQSVAVELRGLRVAVPDGPVALPAVPVALTLGTSLSFEVLVPVGLTSLFRAFDAPDVPFANVTGISLEPGLVSFDEISVFVNGRDFFSAPSDRGRNTGNGVVFDLAI